MDNEKSIKEIIRPIMEGMVYDLVCDKPENIVSAFLNSDSLYDQLASKIWRLHF
jgi:hypothetical protein